MSSVSTLVIKRPETIRSKALDRKTRYPLGFIPLCLWTFAAIVAAANAETSNSVTGVSLTFKVQDVLMMLLTTCMLARGLSTGNPYLIYPWIFISSWNMYHCQYPTIAKMMNIIRNTKGISKLAYVAFTIDVLGAITKLLLIYRVFHLSINLWYQQKLQKETMSK